MTLFRCQVYLGGQTPINWGHHLYHSKMDSGLSHDKHTPHIDTDVSESLWFNVLIREEAKV